jgi:thioredoxin-like negative regulator of GroEL
VAHGSRRGARRIARDGRVVPVDFSADWCPPCVAMKHDVWPDAAVRAPVSQSCVPVIIDPDRDTTTTARLDVDAIPTVLVLDGSGQILARASYLRHPALSDGAESRQP